MAPTFCSTLFVLPFLLTVSFTNLFPSLTNARATGKDVTVSYSLIPSEWLTSHLKASWQRVENTSNYTVEYNYFVTKETYSVRCGSSSSVCVHAIKHIFPQAAYHEVEVTVREDEEDGRKQEVGRSFMTVAIPQNITSCDLLYNQYVEVDVTTKISMDVIPEIGSDPLRVIWSGIGFRPINTSSRVMYPTFDSPGLQEVKAEVTNIYSECHAFAAFEAEYPVKQAPVFSSVAGNASAIKVDKGDTVAFSCNNTGTSPSFLWQIGDLNATILSSSSCNLDYLFNATGIFNVYLKIENAISRAECDPITVSVKNPAPTPAKVASSVVPSLIVLIVIICVLIALQRYHAWYKRQAHVEHANLLINKASEKKTNWTTKRDYGSVEMLEVV
eukprot:m.176619 g.176619  ORF g.176619 m.176619 type:complete len:386 (-) comp13534_c0_seq1:4377-5534(-)